MVIDIFYIFRTLNIEINIGNKNTNNMKKIVLFLALILSTSAIFAQKNLHQFFADELTKYTTAFNKKDWDKVADMMYPKIFERISKSNMITIVEGMDNMGITMKTNVQKVTKVSKIVNYGADKFCKINYFGIIKVKLSFLMAQTSSMWQDKFEKEFGKKNVSYNEDTNTFTVNANRSMIAVAPKNTTNWKYLDIDSPNAKGLKSLVPVSVQQQLK